MQIDYLSRTRLLLKEEGLNKLAKAHVAVFGVGGVGGYTVEALVRSGIKEISLIDNDYICVSNINRQIIATTDDIGKLKVDVFKERILKINPNIVVHTYPIFFLENTKNDIPFATFDYIVDAIDTVKAKVLLAEIASTLNIPLISSMGAANKVNPMGFMVSDIYKTEMDPLAKVMRHELKKRGIKSLKVVYSKEKPIEPVYYLENECAYKYICKEHCSPHTKKNPPGSNAYVPSACGLLIAKTVIDDLLMKEEKNE